MLLNMSQSAIATFVGWGDLLMNSCEKHHIFFLKQMHTFFASARYTWALGSQITFKKSVTVSSLAQAIVKVYDGLTEFWWLLPKCNNSVRPCSGKHARRTNCWVPSKCDGSRIIVRKLGGSPFIAHVCKSTDTITFCNSDLNWLNHWLTLGIWHT